MTIKTFLKEKAFFMIFILICSIFSVYLIKPVFAEQKVCCEKTKAGDYCLYTDIENCDSNYRTAATTCEQTSYCQLGCCFDETEGICHKNVPYTRCSTIGNTTWYSDENCNIAQCSKGCCVIGTECSFVTQTKCRILSTQYPNLEMDFREDITNEVDCINICRGAEDGCCILTDGSCKFSSREECNSVKGNFNPGKYCSDPALGCDCTKHHHKGCLANEDDVYWFDSCGNKENIAEDCDYAEGTLCGQDKEGNYICKSLDCETTFKDPRVDYSGVSRKNGESWCMYEGATGPSLDLVGSRHYRHLCINGQELVEPCIDFREEFCIQMDITNTPQGKYREAFCKENRWEDCTTICKTADPKDLKDNEEKYNADMKKDKECCENTQLRDCVWINSSESTEEKIRGMCIPLTPPGLKFWSTESEGETPTSNTESVCSKGDTECKYVMERWKLLFIRTRWKCVEGCECCKDDRGCTGNDEFIKGTNMYCRSLGDCGAHYNTEIKFTKDGYSITQGKLKQEWFDDERDWKDSEEGLYLGPIDMELDIESIDVEALGGWEAAWEKYGSFLVVTAGAYAIAWLFKITPPLWSTFLGIISHPISFIAHPGQFISTLAAAEGVTALGAAITVIFIIILIIFILIALGTQQEVRTVSVTCLPWQAPPGGDDCEKCTDELKKQELKNLNGNPFNTCTEYKCKSLGQACSIANEGTLNVGCVDVNPYDVNSPIITPWEEILSKESCVNSNCEIKELNYGYEIIPEIKPFTPITFGIETDELAQCKLSTEHTTSFDLMPSNYFSVLYTKQHSITLNLENGKQFDYYVRCQDIHGNANTAEYVIRLKTQTGPDLTPPRIESTSIPNNAYLPYGTNSTLLSVYVNEPAQCKWDRIDTDYDLMENNFSCEYAITENIAYYKLYECITVLTNLEEGKENTFYFRCKDQPLEPDDTKRNAMQESYVFTLKGTTELLITDTQPTGDLYVRNITLKATTTGGAENGIAVCAFDTKDTVFPNMIEFLNTNSTAHTQPLIDLETGNYKYYVKCEDVVRNEANSIIEFVIKVDTKPPEVVHIYKDSIALHLILNEDSSCEYSTTHFRFGEGINMPVDGTKEHAASLQNIYHIICQDIYGNEMSEITVYP